MRKAIAILILSVLTAGCSSTPEITTLAPTTTTVAPSTFDAESLVVTKYPGLDGIMLSIPLPIGYSNGSWLMIGGLSPFGNYQAWESNDGAVWEPLELPARSGRGLLGLLAVESGGWILLGGFYGSEGVEVWVSDDGASWNETGILLNMGFHPQVIGYASSGRSVGLLIGSDPSGYMGTETSNLLYYTTDGGVTWDQAPINGEPVAVTKIGGDLIVGGSLDGQPTLWKLSTGWKPEKVVGLEDPQGVQGLVEMPDGSFILQTVEPNKISMTWFASDDMTSWTVIAPPAGVPDRVVLSHGDGFILGTSSQQTWLSTDGTNWHSIVYDELLPFDSEMMPPGTLTAMVFASDGTTLIGANSYGMLSDHPMVLAAPEYPGAWELVTRLGPLGEFWGIGFDRYVVRQGGVEALKGGELVPLPPAPVVFADLAKIGVTESVIFVESQGEVWAFHGDEWNRTNLPEATEWTEVVERSGVFVVMSVDAGEVRKYVSEDGIRWTSATMERVLADSVRVDRAGHFVASSSGAFDPEDPEAPTDYQSWASVDGKEWVPEGEFLAGGVELVDDTVVVRTLDGEFEFDFPAGAEYRLGLGGTSDWVLVLANKDQVSYLLVLTSDGEEIWIPREFGDPLLMDGWYDGSSIYGVAYENGAAGAVNSIYVWNPDAE